MRPPRLRCALFPLIYPPHLLVLPTTFGLYLLLQTYPYFRALYVIPVRRTKSLLTASFRFHLAMDTLAVRLYTSSLPRRVRDLHPLERAHGAQTKRLRHEAQSYISYKIRFQLIDDPLSKFFSGTMSASSPSAFSAHRSMPSETTPASFAGFKFSSTITFLPTISSGE